MSAQAVEKARAEAIERVKATLGVDLELRVRAARADADANARTAAMREKMLRAIVGNEMSI